LKNAVADLEAWRILKSRRTKNGLEMEFWTKNGLEIEFWAKNGLEIKFWAKNLLKVGKISHFRADTVNRNQ